MDSYEFDNIKAEKAKAIKRAQIEENLKNLLYTLEICVVLLSIPCFFNWFPLALKTCFTHVRNLVIHFFHKTFYVFLLTNVLVFVLAIRFYLKRDDISETKSDIYEEFINASECGRKVTAAGDFPVPEFIHSDQSTICVHKEIVYSVNKVNRINVQEHAVDCSKTKKAADREIVGAKEMRQLKEFRRSSTESYRKVERRELRRSKTGSYSRTMRCVDEPPRRSVEDMSSEEFRSEIEKFIAMQKRMQFEERKDDSSVWTKKTQPCLAIISQG